MPAFAARKALDSTTGSLALSAKESHSHFIESAMGTKT
jgi:hypothetical protein